MPPSTPDVAEMIQHAGDDWAKHWNAKQLDKRAERGKYLAVWRREKGNWKLVADSWSSDLLAPR